MTRMKIIELRKIIAGESFAGDTRAMAVLPRYAAMCGFPLAEANVRYPHHQDGNNVEVPMDVVQKILALDFAERSTADLRAMGEGIGKLSVQVPSNINVWQHLKGEAPLREAANRLTAAAEMLAEKVTEIK